MNSLEDPAVQITLEDDEPDIISNEPTTQNKNNEQNQAKQQQPQLQLPYSPSANKRISRGTTNNRMKRGTLRSVDKYRTHEALLQPTFLGMESYGRNCCFVYTIAVAVEQSDVHPQIKESESTILDQNIQQQLYSNDAVLNGIIEPNLATIHLLQSIKGAVVVTAVDPKFTVKRWNQDNQYLCQINLLQPSFFGMESYGIHFDISGGDTFVFISGIILHRSQQQCLIQDRMRVKGGTLRSVDKCRTNEALLQPPLVSPRPTTPICYGSREEDEENAEREPLKNHLPSNDSGAVFYVLQLLTVYVLLLEMANVAVFTSYQHQYQGNHHQMMQQQVRDRGMNEQIYT
jgi:hypothetical protein